MLCNSGGQEVNCFALVTYIPDPLGKFLDDLRRELVPGCVPHAHVTILPPRPLPGTPEAAIKALRTKLADFAPFEIKAGKVEIFPVSDVVYLSIEEGARELLPMHRALNRGPLEYKEPFPYHPHITLAQELTREQSVQLAAVAASRLAQYSYPRAFRAESLVFVQSTACNSWVDLANFELHPAPSVRR